ncbi:Cytochrome C4 [Candidatus Terasakiella magnetica]|nr:Cytochrome C4 [Candidatus Terasakiella magnetica]
MIMKRFALVLSVLMLAPAVQAAEDGKALYASKGCPACHGAEGRKPLPLQPNLAGQNSAYLLRQMTEIANGTRSAPAAKPMRPIIEKVSPDERKVIAAWLATQPAAEVTVGSAAKAAQGLDLFEERGCIGCHGADGLKPLSDYPILGGQRKDYLGAQIRAIRDEVRSTQRARMMVANVRSFKDAEIDQITEYLSQAKRK